jgi:hypothetical protein
MSFRVTNFQDIYSQKTVKSKTLFWKHLLHKIISMVSGNRNSTLCMSNMDFYVWYWPQTQIYIVPARHTEKKAQRERKEVAIIALLADSGMGGGDRFLRLQKSFACLYCSWLGIFYFYFCGNSSLTCSRP